MSTMINRAQQALSGFMTGASTASKNIEHAADKNYSRETVTYRTGTGGQLVVNVTRMSNNFLSSRRALANSELAMSNARYDSTSAIDKMVTGSTITKDGDKYENLLQSAISKLSTSWDNLLIKDTPSTRRAIAADFNNVQANFNDVSQSLDRQQKLLNSQIKTSADSANHILKQLSELNDLITKTESGDQQNDLLNRQATLIQDLAQHVSINARYAGNGTVRIELQSGMTLVAGTKYRTLDVRSNEYGHDNAIFVNNKKISDNPQLLSGDLGGLLYARDHDLAQAQRKVGLIATAMTDTYNNVNKEGFTQDSKPGGNLLIPLQAGAEPSNKNIGNASLVITTDPKKINDLTDQPLLLKKTATGIEVINPSTHRVVANGTKLPIQANGLNIQISSGRMVSGDTFLIDPMKNAAGKFEMAMDDNGTAIAEAGKSPVSAGDNENVHRFVEIKDEKVMMSNTASIAEGLSSEYVDIGINTSSALSELQNARSMQESADDEWSAYSGVNLEEERISLMGFEKNYQAASKIIQTSQKMWSSIIDVIN